MGPFLHEFFSPLDFLRAMPQVWDGFQTQPQADDRRGGVRPRRSPCSSQSSAACPDGSRLPFRGVAIAYTDIFRGTPLILVLLIVRGLRRAELRRALRARRCSGTASIALVLVYTAYVTEVYRAGIESVHPSQRMAAALARAELHAGDALRRPAAGDPTRHPAAPQRLHRPAEGHRAHHRHRADRGGCAGRLLLERLRELRRATRSRRSSSSSSRSRSRASPTTSSSSGSGASGRRPYERRTATSSRCRTSRSASATSRCCTASTSTSTSTTSSA